MFRIADVAVNTVTRVLLDGGSACRLRLRGLLSGGADSPSAASPCQRERLSDPQRARRREGADRIMGAKAAASSERNDNA